MGKWRLDVDIKATATTQAIEASGTEDCELFANMHLVCKADAGAYRSMRTLSDIPGLKQYGSYSYVLKPSGTATPPQPSTLAPMASGSLCR